MLVRFQSSSRGPRGQNPRFFFDMNDPNLVFEEDQEGEEENRTALAPVLAENSSAVIMAPTKPSEIPDLLDIDDPTELMQAINISKDDVYFAAPKRKGIKGRAIHHSKFALQLWTIPVNIFTPRGNYDRAMFWHRPKSIIAPLIPPCLPGSRPGAMTVFLSTLFPEVTRRLVIPVGDIPNTTVETLWEGMSSMKAYSRDVNTMKKSGIKPAFFVPGNPPMEIPGSATLADEIFKGQKSGQLFITVVYQDIDWFKTRDATQVPVVASSNLLRPPFVFTERHELMAGSQGSIYLVEHMEEFPMLVNHAGMGAKLSTYYRKKTPSDQAYLTLAKNKAKWKTGSVAALGEGRRVAVPRAD